MMAMTIKRIGMGVGFVALGFALGAAAPTFGQATDTAQKQTPPPGSAPKAFTVPAHETYSLPNGMKVTLVPYGNIPKATISLALRSGNIDETSDKLGLADITGDLLKEGTKTMSSEQVAQAAAQMGSSLGVGVGVDETTVAMDVLSESGSAAVKLIADVVQHPLLPESELARLKTNALRQIAVAKTQPAQIALAKFRKLMYGDHPYGEVLPTEETINGLTIADAQKFYAANFGAARAHLYVAGKFDSAALKKAIAQSFGSWAKGTPALSSTLVPVMSDGIRSGVNWIRLKLTSRILAIELTIKVLASPGTPTKSTWPRVKIAAKISSTTSRWPMMTLFSSLTITSREWRNSSRSCVIRSPAVDMR